MKLRSRQVGHERRGLLRPGDVAVDVRPDHRVAGLGVERLVRRGVEDEAIDALGEPVVGDFLQVVGGFVPAAGERLGRDQRLAVDVGCRSGAAHVHGVHQLAGGAPAPRTRPSECPPCYLFSSVSSGISSETPAASA